MQKRWKCTICGQIFIGDTPPVPCPICGASEDAFVLLEETPSVDYFKDTLDRFVIIGGGAAGLEACKAIRLRNNTCTIRLIAGEGIIPYNRPALSDVLADGYSFEAIALEPFEFYRLNRIELTATAKVESIDPEACIVHLTSGQTFPYDKLLIATGANPFNPIARTDDAIPSFTLRTFTDVGKIEAAARGKRAIVVGGGILGLEAALALTELGASVTVLELSDRLLALQADAVASERIRHALDKKGVRSITGKSVKHLTATGAILTDDSALEADCAVVSIGVRSEITLGKQLGLCIGRGIQVDGFMRTSMPDVFAAGDCAEYDGRVMGLWSVASCQGQIAGAAMAGDFSAFYEPAVPATAFDVGELSMFSAGTLNGKASLTREDEQTGTYRKLYFAEGKLVGAMFVGDIQKSGQAIAMIQQGANAEDAKELL